MYEDLSVLQALDQEWSVILLEGDRVADASGKALALLKYGGRSQIVGLPYEALLYQRITASLLEEIREAFQRGERWSGELKLRLRGTEEWMWAECDIRKVGESPNGRLVTLCSFRDLSKVKVLERKVYYSECYDALTMLPNRAFFGYRLTTEVDKAAKTPGRRLLLLLLDLDRFKVVNDSLGHAFGDMMLKEIANRLRACADETTLLGRMGANQFAALFKSNTTEPFDSRVEAVIEAVGNRIRIDRHDLSFTCSAGASSYPEDTREADNLVKHAELALAAAKDQGRNRLMYFEHGMNASAMRLLLLPNYLRLAVERKEFEVYYQPKQRLSDFEVYGMEALIRWKSPDLGWVPPSEFIPAAEELGFINEIGSWVLRTACAQAREWLRESGKALVVSVNLSSKQFQQHDVSDAIASILDETGLPPELLELELTESSVMLFPQESAQMLKRLKGVGVSVSVDDFGTGFSSLNYLSVFPLDTLKIDKSFVQAMVNDAKNAALVEGIIELGHKLGLSIVAEGVETLEQREALAACRCDHIQGYLVSPPVPASQFKEEYIGQSPLSR